ncbi:MAG: lamin tail domain-containing protein, partial [Candidatus Uhrbacteria bacterium]
MHRAYFLFVLSVVFLGGVPSMAVAGNHVVISEIQVGGESAKDEYVELYNPTSEEISLEGWRLSKRTSSGSESNLLTAFPAISVAAGATARIAHPEGIFAGEASATYSTKQSLAPDNSCVLYGPVVNDERPIVDLVGWGEVVSFEGSAATQNPDPGDVIQRSNGADTDDNAADFTLRSATGADDSADDGAGDEDGESGDDVGDQQDDGDGEQGDTGDDGGDSGDDAGDQQDDTGDTGDDGSENNAASPGGGSPTITAPSWPTHVKL